MSEQSNENPGRTMMYDFLLSKSTQDFLNSTAFNARCIVSAYTARHSLQSKGREMTQNEFAIACQVAGVALLLAQIGDDEILAVVDVEKLTVAMMESNMVYDSLSKKSDDGG